MGVGWFLHDNRIEVAAVEEKKADYSIEELNKIEKLAKSRRKKVFKTSKEAKNFNGDPLIHGNRICPFISSNL